MNRYIKIKNFSYKRIIFLKFHLITSIKPLHGFLTIKKLEKIS